NLAGVRLPNSIKASLLFSYSSRSVLASAAGCSRSCSVTGCWSARLDPEPFGLRQISIGVSADFQLAELRLKADLKLIVRQPYDHSATTGTASQRSAARRSFARRLGPGPPGVASGQPTAWPPVKKCVRKFMTLIASACHTLCPSAARVIISNIVKNTAQVIVICALPGHRFALLLP